MLQGMIQPPTDAIAITPHASTEQRPTGVDFFRALWVGNDNGADGSDVAITTRDGRAVTLRNVAPGVWHSMCFTHVFATGTEAVEILGGW